MQGHFYKPNCKCIDSKGESKKSKKCSCGATWSYILDVGFQATGKRKQKKKGGFRTKGDAEEAAALLVAELAKGTYVEESNINFKEFSQVWLDAYINKGKVKNGTIRVRKHEIGNLMPYFEFLKMKEITRQQYQDALNDLKKRLADNTVDGIHSTGRTIFKYAVEIGSIRTDPTQYTYVPKVQKTLEQVEQEKINIKYLEKEELALLLKTAKEKGMSDDYLIFLILSYSGLRVGELCALKRTDFDFKEHKVNVTKTYYNPNNNTVEYVLGTPKTKKSVRKIDLEPIIFDELEKHFKQQDDYKRDQGDNYYDKDYVFVSTEYPGYPYYIKKIQNRFKLLLKLAGLNQELTPHSLRHTHTSLLAEAGVGLIDIMDRLGHEDDETTKYVYLHVTKAKKKEASQKFGELMRSF
jgi:integrase